MLKPSEMLRDTFYELNFEDKPFPVNFDSLNVGDVIVVKKYFDEIVEILGRKPDWIRVGTEGKRSLEEMKEYFQMIEHPRGSSNITKRNWYWGLQYLGKSGDEYIYKALYSKKRDIDGSCEYYQAPVELLRADPEIGAFPCEAENWSKYRDKVVWM